MASVVLTGTSASPQTWSVPSNCPAGTLVSVEDWGAGSGGSGGNTSNRSGGAGGAYATDTYYVTPDNVANGVSYILQAGGAGSGSANSTLGPDTTWASGNAANLISNSQARGATSSSLPTNWLFTTGATGLTQTVVGAGITSSGYPYVDINFSGTATGSTSSIGVFVDQIITIAVSTNYTYSLYVALVGGSLTNINSCQLQLLEQNSGTFVAAPNNAISPTSTLQRFTWSLTTTTGVNQGQPYFDIWFNTLSTINATFRIAAPQFEQASSATVWKSTPGFVTAKGGGATSGTTGGVGGPAASCVPTTGAFSGGHGASHTQGGGGGGAAGKDGAGGSPTTGTGGGGDNGVGGAAGVSNVEGGGGATAGTAPGAGGAPGGGGGANTSTGSGSAGGRGQIRLTWTPPPTYTFRPTQAAILAR